jgi:hypothetical protein
MCPFVSYEGNEVLFIWHYIHNNNFKNLVTPKAAAELDLLPNSSNGQPKFVKNPSQVGLKS